jgi:hypothetical protein
MSRSAARCLRLEHPRGRHDVLARRERLRDHRLVQLRGEVGQRLLAERGLDEPAVDDLDVAQVGEQLALGRREERGEAGEVDDGGVEGRLDDLLDLHELEDADVRAQVERDGVATRTGRIAIVVIVGAGAEETRQHHDAASHAEHAEEPAPCRRLQQFPRARDDHGVVALPLLVGHSTPPHTPPARTGLEDSRASSHPSPIIGPCRCAATRRAPRRRWGRRRRRCARCVPGGRRLFDFLASGERERDFYAA